ncbi:general secretion pathway protein J [Oceanisphaera litoralis]|uniref:prepilin-type N-terminal cleavage/methylation domain-containing protein n=1 Tax=Oceanisphaera litoralis TaxID=225144 RepID=UPI0019589CF5|nr:prepilin-type N-terminal cleavage/methylation domain-containing protein [Oceanisphaera litoralis]MBM7456044.1 general secretion pathway protein J [Oceanisphaera litoralis]
MKRQPGFTLLELVVSLTLLTLLSGLMFGGFRLAGKAWETVGERNADNSEQIQLQRFLRNLLEQAEPLHVQTARQIPLLSFQGTEHSLIFLAPQPRGLGNSAEPVWFYLALDNADPEHPVLSLKSQPLVVETEPQEQAPPVDWYQLLDDFRQPDLIPPLLELEIASFSLHYLSADEQNMSAWQPEWLDQDQLPALIRLQLDPDSPPLVVASRQYRYEIKDEY